MFQKTNSFKNNNCYRQGLACNKTIYFSVTNKKITSDEKFKHLDCIRVW